MGDMYTKCTTFFELYRLHRTHSSFRQRWPEISSGPPLFRFQLPSNILLWLFKRLCILFNFFFLTVFLLRIVRNGLSMLKCLSSGCRKYLPMLFLLRLQEWWVKPDYFSISFLMVYFECLSWLSPYLRSSWFLLQLLLLMAVFPPLELEFIAFTCSSLSWNSLLLMISSYILLLSSKFYFT